MPNVSESNQIRYFLKGKCRIKSNLILSNHFGYQIYEYRMSGEKKKCQFKLSIRYSFSSQNVSGRIQVNSIFQVSRYFLNGCSMLNLSSSYLWGEREWEIQHPIFCGTNVVTKLGWRTNSFFYFVTLHSWVKNCLKFFL